MELAAIDYVVFSISIIFSICLGLYPAFTGGKQSTIDEFFLSNRKLKTIPVTLSIVVSFVSGIAVLGTPAEVYVHGIQLTMRTIGYCLACALSALLFVPLFYKLQLTSCFEYLDMRYRSKMVRRLGASTFLMSNVR